MNNLKIFLEKFKTKNDSTFIKKQILNSVLMNLISLVALICGTILLIIGFIKSSNVYDAFGLFFIIVFFIFISLSWTFLILLKQNIFFIKENFGSKFNLLFIAFWLGFKFVDILTEQEIKNNYLNLETTQKQISNSIKIKNNSLYKNSEKELVDTTKILDAVTQISLKDQDFDENQKLSQKLEEYKNLLKQQKELEFKLLEIKKSKTHSEKLELDQTLLIEKIETKILQKTIKIEETEKEVDLLISAIDLSSKTKMIHKKKELQKLLEFYEKQKLFQKNKNT